jgi:hypothetical protein
MKCKVKEDGFGGLSCEECGKEITAAARNKVDFICPKKKDEKRSGYGKLSEAKQ